MKHIVQVLTDTNVGGAGKYLLNYLKGFNREKYKVTVVLPEGSRLCAFVHGFNDVTLIEAPHMADCSFDKHAVFFLKKLFKKIKPDILHTHACLSARIAGKWAKVPTILATRHCIEPLPHGFRALAISAFNNALCDYYIAVSEAVVKNLTDSGIRRDKIKRVANGVEPVKPLTNHEKMLVRAQHEVKDDETLFGIFGRLETVKGHKYFIKAARQVLREAPNTKFMIVGGGSLEMDLHARARRYGIYNNMIFTGFVPNTSLLLNAVDVNVCASESEAMSLAILEAMSLGKPTIATNAGGNRELITNNKTGLMVGYADSASLAQAMLRLHKDPDFAKELGDAARDKYEMGYTVDAMVARLEEVYEEVFSDVH